MENITEKMKRATRRQDEKNQGALCLENCM